MNFLVVLLFSCVAFSQDKPYLPNETIRKDLFLKVVNEINRLDGDGLIPRKNRSENWLQLTTNLSNEAAKAKTLYDYGHVFQKLDAAYPNLHSRVYLHKDLDSFDKRGPLYFKFQISPNVKEEKAESFDYYILVKDQYKNSTELKTGDQILEINGVPIKKVEEENLNYCDMPLKYQCALWMNNNFTNEIIWTRDQDLVFTVKRGTQIIKINAKPEEPGWDKYKDSPVSEETCESVESRYPDFFLVYKGVHLCAFESKKFSSQIVVRISSFAYAPEESITNQSNEVELFYVKYWKKKSSRTKTVILDVTDNHGGDAPIPYYEIFSPKAFQEQYVQFKKIKELEEPEIQKEIFWNDPARKIWFNDLNSTGTFQKTAEGGFLPQAPQFCADDKKNCNEGQFKPRNHKFRGRVKIMINRWCVSSCVGFVYNMIDIFKGRISSYGHADSADSAFSRIAINAMVEKDKVKVFTSSRKKTFKSSVDEPWIRQIVSITKSTDKEGNILSGQPQKIDYWVAKPWDMTEEQWGKEVFKRVMSTK